MYRRTTLLTSAIVLGLIAPYGVAAQDIRYDVSFPNAVHHEAEITIHFTGLPAVPLELRVSRSSPGRYALHEFGKNVFNVRAVDSNNNPLRIQRPNPYQWNVLDHAGTATVTYTLFADRGGGTYSQIDETHAHLNMPATFMWARGLQDRPIVVSFSPPAGAQWRAATQLLSAEGPSRLSFRAPNFQYFMDSPTELSDFSLREWPVESGAGGTGAAGAAGAGTQTIRLAVHHAGTEAEVDAFADMVKKVVAEQIAVFGEAPEYDGGTYTFIADYLPWVSGDGMEHRNSTIVASTGSLAEDALDLLGTVSHEYFHAWNVERIRPRSLEPFDFERANMSDALWFAEGFTSYYTSLFIRRAGIIDDEEFARSVSGRLNTVINSPGREFFSPIEMSMQAPFVDAARAIDPTNQANTFISYYTWGAMIGLNLDLTLRERGLTLDDYMRLLWDRYGKDETPYTVDDLELLLGEFAGDPVFALEFFDRFIRGRGIPDYRLLLERAGFLVRRARPGRPTMGRAQLRFANNGATLEQGSLIGTPLYDAGIDRGARIVQLDSIAITSAQDVATALSGAQPGDTIPVVFTQRGRTHETTLVLIEDPTIEVIPYETTGLTIDKRMREFRAVWLGSRAQGTEGSRQ